MSYKPSAPPTYDLSSGTAPTNNVIIVNGTQSLGRYSQRMQCYRCQKQIVTRTEPHANNKTHIIALVLCLIGCCLCAPCVYCSDRCRGVEHYCPECNAMLGICSD